MVTSSLPAQIAFSQFPAIPGFVRRLPRFVVNRLSSHASLGYASFQHRDRSLGFVTALTSSFFPASSLTTQSRGLSWEHCFRVLHLAARQSLILVVRRGEAKAIKILAFRNLALKFSVLLLVTSLLPAQIAFCQFPVTPDCARRHDLRASKLAGIVLSPVWVTLRILAATASWGLQQPFKI